MIPLLSEDFAAFHIENFLTMTDVYCGLYDEEYTTEEAKNPIRVKWAFAAQFCNDLSKKHNLEPCYYLNGEPVSAINFDITGKDFECRYENNGWRLPTKDEAKLPIFGLYGDMIQREGWEWTNEDGEWLTGESKIIVRASDDSDLEKGICKLEETNSDPEEKEASVYAEVLRMLNLQADILLLLIKNLHRKMRKYMDEKCIDNFINKLRDCDFSFTQPVENIYSRNVEGNENTFNNLRLYLNKMKDIKPKYLLIGEAPGYNGCRWSGIPFVSERILRDNNFFGLENGYKVRNDNKPQSEASATIVWNCLNEIGIFPLIWNAFPFHPYQKEKTKSNRTPNKEELVFGKDVLKDILQLFNIEPTNVIAVGKKAKESLETFPEFETIKCIRHPANGGKADFVKGLKTYLI